jgi:hypothetical protein
MISVVTAAEAERAARMVGLGSGAIGAAILAAPDACSRALGLDAVAAMRVIGAADLAVAPGLLVGRSRARWMAARAGLNVAIVAFLAIRGHGQLRPRIAGAALLAVTAADARVLAPLRAAA